MFESEYRLKFFGLNDGATYHQVDEVEEILSSFDFGQEDKGISDVLELHEATKFIENDVFPLDFSENDKARWKSLIPKIKELLGRYFSGINDHNFEACVAGLYWDYHADLLSMLSHYKMYERLSPEVLLSACVSAGMTMNIMLGDRSFVNFVGVGLKRLLLQNSQYAELIMKKHLEKDASDIFVPVELSLEEQRSLVKNYIASHRANPNYLQLIARAPVYKDQLVDARLKLEARRASARWFEQMANENQGFRVSSEAIIVADQADEVLLESQGAENKYSYSREWLEDTLDPASILNNFMFVFEFSDGQALLTFPSYKSEIGPFESSLGLKGPKFYSHGLAFLSKEQSSFAKLEAYLDFLSGNGIQIEEVLEWFFGDYLETEFGAANFRFIPSSSSSTYLQKCRHLFPEMDSIFRQFTIFSEDGELDPDILTVMSEAVEYENVPSLLSDKYIAVADGQKIQNILVLLFSSQSRLRFIDSKRQAGNFCQLLLRHTIRYDDLRSVQKPSVDFLIKQEVLECSDGVIRFSSLRQVGLLNFLYRKEAINYHRLGESDRDMVDSMVKAGWLYSYSSLLSRPEASYFNYILNQKEFTNGPDLRNKYAHGSNQDASNEIEHYVTYLHILKMLIGAVIKINEEFRLHHG